MRVLVDTDIVIDLERGEEDVINLFKQVAPSNDLAISTITIAEVFGGAHLSEKEGSVEKARELLMRFEWEDMDPEIAEKVGQISAERTKNGNPAGFQDDAVLATFYTTKADFLITNNKKHYEEFLPEERLLSVKDALGMKEVFT